MAQPIAIRRAAIYRQRAQQLTETAKDLRDEVDRRHLRDLAATFQRAADAMAPASEPAERDKALLAMPRDGAIIFGDLIGKLDEHIAGWSALRLGVGGLCITPVLEVASHLKAGHELGVRGRES